MAGNESLRHSYCELPVSGLSASPCGRDVFRASVCLPLTVIETARHCDGQRERETRKKERKKIWPTTHTHPNCKSCCIIFSGLRWAVPEVKIHRRDLPLRTLRDNITGIFCHSGIHIFVINDGRPLPFHIRKRREREREKVLSLFSLFLNRKASLYPHFPETT